MHGVIQTCGWVRRPFPTTKAVKLPPLTSPLVSLMTQERVGLALEMALDRFAMVESLLRQGVEKSLEYLRSSGISPREEKHILESKDPAKLRDRLMKTVMYHIRPVAGIDHKSWGGRFLDCFVLFRCLDWWRGKRYVAVHRIKVAPPRPAPPPPPPPPGVS